MNVNHRKLESWKVKPMIYREENVTICMLVDAKHNLVSRGVALLSARDNPEKKLGNNIALGRAVKAYENRSNSEEIRRRDAWGTVIPLIWESDSFKYKSSYKPNPTQRESEMLARVASRESK